MILTPDEVRKIEREFTDYADEVDGEDRLWREQARVIFLLDVIAGPRRGEVLGFHWRDVDLAEPTGAVLRVRETWVRSTKDTPKSEAGERAIPLGPWLAEELWQHRRRTAFAGDDERVFCSPTKGTPFDVTRYATTLRAVLKRVGIDRPIRPFHDLRHTAITNDAAAGNSPLAIMKHAGHTDFKTTQRYIDLAGITFRKKPNALNYDFWVSFRLQPSNIPSVASRLAPRRGHKRASYTLNRNPSHSVRYKKAVQIPHFRFPRQIAISGFWWVMQLGSAASARAELRADLTANKAAGGGSFSAFPVPAIPGAQGFRVSGGGSVGENIFFADGPFLYLVGHGFSSGNKTPPTRAGLIAAVKKLYARVHGHPAG